MPGHTGNVLKVAYAKGGKTAVSISTDGTPRLWNVAIPGDLVAAACANAFRSVTRAEWARYAPGGDFPNVCR